MQLGTRNNPSPSISELVELLVVTLFLKHVWEFGMHFMTVMSKYPKTVEEWECLAKEFETEWNFPNCVGAIDGKHIAIERSTCWILVHLAGTMIQGFLQNLSLKTILKTMFAVFQNQKVGDLVIPYLIVGDGIFPLKTWLMKPMAGKNLSKEYRVYNYRLSRCRRTTENAFGILSARWKIFRRPIRASPVTVDRIVQATICLHNYLRLTENSMYIPSGFVDSEDNTGNIRPGDWRAMVVGDNGGLLNLGQMVETGTGSKLAKYEQI